jgi:nucleoid-associated protein YgaU
MKTVLACFGALALALGLLGCPSAPPPPPAVEAPAPAVVAEKPPEPAPAAPQKPPAEQPKPPAAVSDEEVAAVGTVLARARDWAAEFYAPAEYRDARSAFAAALDVRASDPDRSRRLLADAGQKADAAFAAAVERYGADMRGRITAVNDRLLAMEADRYDPDGYAKAVAGAPQTETLYRARDYEAARTLAVTTLKQMLDFERAIGGRLDTVQGLREAAEAAMKDAEQMEAARWAPDERKRANERFTDGLVALRAHELGSAEMAFRDARDQTEQLVRLVAERSAAASLANRTAADELMQSLAKELEDSAGLTVVTEDGTVIGPAPWSADEELKNLMQEEPPVPLSLRIPEDGSTIVLGDTSTIATLLAQAREHWRQGVLARDRGDYAAAIEQFRVAGRLLDIYRAQAVSDTYVVRSIPSRADCLWRIAEYPQVYGNPRLWPLLWRENRAVITDPDLIEPGMRLIVPPLADDRSRQLAEAFWLAGQQYTDAGKNAKGSEYQAAARVVWPGLEAGAIAEPVRLDVSAQVAAATRTPPRSGSALEESVRSAFLRLGGAFREDDLPGMLDFVGGSLYLTDHAAEVNRAAVSEAFWALLSDPKLGRLPWASIYDLSTVTVLHETSAGPDAYSLFVTPLEDLPLSEDPTGIATAGQTQRFHFRRSGSAWRIAAIGLAETPPGWHPAPGPSIAPYQPIATAVTLPGPETVVGAFSAWLSAWLSGNADEGLRRTAESVELRSSGEELSGAELRRNLGGWFSAASRVSTAAADLVDLDGAAVESAGRNTYRLTVRTRRDLSAVVPYWKSCQDYYLRWQDGVWKVEAIF